MTMITFLGYYIEEKGYIDLVSMHLLNIRKYILLDKSCVAFTPSPL